MPANSMPVDGLVFAIPLCCVTGACAYHTFYWHKRFKSQENNTLPKGVRDDSNWIPPGSATENMPSKQPYRDIARMHEKADVAQKDLDPVATTIRQADLIKERRDDLKELEGMI